MKLSKMIPILQKFLKNYGDCEVVRLNHIGMTGSIDKIEFIGGSQLLLMANEFYDRSSYKLYQSSQKVINEKRKKEWLKDCESDLYDK